MVISAIVKLVCSENWLHVFQGKRFQTLAYNTIFTKHLKQYKHPTTLWFYRSKRRSSFKFCSKVSKFLTIQPWATSFIIQPPSNTFYTICLQQDFIRLFFFLHLPNLHPTSRIGAAENSECLQASWIWRLFASFLNFNTCKILPTTSSSFYTCIDLISVSVILPVQ